MEKLDIVIAQQMMPASSVSAFPKITTQAFSVVLTDFIRGYISQHSKSLLPQIMHTVAVHMVVVVDYMFFVFQVVFVFFRFS